MSDGFDPLALDDDDVEDEGTEPSSEDGRKPKGAESSVISDIRKHARTLERKLKSAENELNELREFKMERVKQERTSAAEKAFQELGLNPNNAKLFTALNAEGEITVDGVASFAKEYGLIAEDAEVPTKEEDTPRPEGFTPVTTSRGPEVVSLDPDEARQLARTNVEEYVRLRKAGRIKPETLEDAFPS